MGLLTNMASYWKMTETSGNRADSHGSRTLTDVSTVPYSNTGPVYTNWADLRDSADYLENSDSLLKIGDNDWSLMMWLHCRQYSDYFVGAFGASGDYGWRAYIGYSPGKCTFQYSQNGTSLGALTSTDNLGVGAAKMVVLWHDSVANEVGLQIDAGTYDSQAISDGGIYESSVTCKFGRSTGSAPLSGWMGPCALWNRVLTSADCDELYNSGSGLKYEDIPADATTGGARWFFAERYRNFLDDLKYGNRLRQREAYI